jgi:hypothetical protein
MAPPRIEIDTLSIRYDTRVLSHDSMRGRATGERGSRLAAAYIVERLRAMGLSPAAGAGYLQPVPLRQARLQPESRLWLHTGRDSVTFLPGIDFVPGSGTASAFREFAGPAIFAGVGANAALALRDVDVAGRVIVLAGPLAENADSLVRAWTAARAAGLLLLITDPDVLQAIALNLGPDRFFVDADVDEPTWQNPLPALYAGGTVARMLLAGTSIPDAAIRGDAFQALPLRWNVDARTAVATDDVDGSNIVALVPGSDPRLRDEYVLFTAHYDHLGVGPPENGDSIYNGFSDNAAGVAMLLAMAEHTMREPAARSVAFAFFTGEERGLLGSSFFAAFPTLPLERVRAVINLDGGAPPVPPISWRIAGGLGTDLGRLAETVALRNGWTADLTATRANSDHWPFLARGVPAIFVIPGNDWENTTAAQRDSLRERFDHYHRPADEWREDYPFSGLQRYAAYALTIGLVAANQDESGMTRPEGSAGRHVDSHRPGRTGERLLFTAESAVNAENGSCAALPADMCYPGMARIGNILFLVARDGCGASGR